MTERKELKEIVERGLVVLLLIVLGITGLAVLNALSEAMEIWLQYRWVPLARIAAGLIIGGGALYALKLLLQRR